MRLERAGDGIPSNPGSYYTEESAVPYVCGVPIRVFASHMHMRQVVTYGVPHTRTGKNKRKSYG